MDIYTYVVTHTPTGDTWAINSYSPDAIQYHIDTHLYNLGRSNEWPYYVITKL